jgi:hypothetical protein
MFRWLINLFKCHCVVCGEVAERWGKTPICDSCYYSYYYSEDLSDIDEEG